MNPGDPDVGIRCFRSLDLGLITKESKVLQSYSLHLLTPYLLFSQGMNLKNPGRNGLLILYSGPGHYISCPEWSVIQITIQITDLNSLVFRSPSNNRQFDNWTTFDHSNARIVQYSDSHCRWQFNYQVHQQLWINGLRGHFVEAVLRPLADVWQIQIKSAWGKYLEEEKVVTSKLCFSLVLHLTKTKHFYFKFNVIFKFNFEILDINANLTHFSTIPWMFAFFVNDTFYRFFTFQVTLFQNRGSTDF